MKQLVKHLTWCSEPTYPFRWGITDYLNPFRLHTLKHWLWKHSKRFHDYHKKIMDKIVDDFRTRHGLYYYEEVEVSE